MTEHATQPDGDRLAAHERLSTGALARLDARVREPPVAGRPRVGRHHRRAHPPGRHRRRQPEGRVRDPGLGHAAGDGPDRGGVRVRAGRRPQPRLRGARGRAPRHARASGRDRAGDRGAPDARVRPDRRGAGGQRRRHERRRPVRREHVLGQRADRLRRGAVRSRDLHGGSRVGRRRAGHRPRGGRPGRDRRRVQRRRRVPADRAGHRRSCSACSWRSSCSSSSSARSSRRRSRSRLRSSR